MPFTSLLGPARRRGDPAVRRVRALLHETSEKLGPAGTWIGDGYRAALHALRDEASCPYVAGLALAVEDTLTQDQPAVRALVRVGIKAGVADSERVLARALRRTSDGELADDFANCGSMLLAGYAHNWARRHRHSLAWRLGHTCVAWGVA